MSDETLSVSKLMEVIAAAKMHSVDKLEFYLADNFDFSSLFPSLAMLPKPNTLAGTLSGIPCSVRSYLPKQTAMLVNRTNGECWFICPDGTVIQWRRNFP